jgi:hypothetical protein
MVGVVHPGVANPTDLDHRLAPHQAARILEQAVIESRLG